MKASERGIIIGVVLAALAIGFYLLILAPKRDQASKLSSQVDDLHASIAQQQQVVSFGEQARGDFPKYYGRLVVLGKAVPARADTSSMLVQLNSIADRSKVQVDSISLGSGGGADSSSAPSSAPSSASTAPSSSSTSTTGTTGSASTSSSSGAAASTTSTPVPATETSAAQQPLGAVVGAAGLPTMPYELGLAGSFFDVSNFIGGLDGLVTPNDGGSGVSPDGRLFTIDGFSLSPSAPGSSTLSGTFSVTTYVTPQDQGLTGGASPGAPAPATPSASSAQPASAVLAK